MVAKRNERGRLRNDVYIVTVVVREVEEGERGERGEGTCT